MYSELYPFLSTVDDKNMLISEVNALLKTTYSSNPNAFADALKAEVRPQIAVVLEKLLEGKEKEQELKAIISFLDSLKEVHVSLVYTPGQQFIEKMAQSLSSPEEHRLLSLDEDVKLGAGAVISCAGKYFDGSFRSKLASFRASQAYPSLLAKILSA